MNLLPFRRILPNASSRTWAAIVIPFWLALTLLLGLGPTLQHFLSAPLVNSAPSLYATALQEGFGATPTLTEWIGYSLYSPYLLLGLLITIVSLRAKSQTGSVIRAALSTAVVLCLFDALVALVGSEHSGPLPLSLLSNLVGAIVVALLWAVALLSLSTVRDHRKNAFWFAGIVVAGALALSLLSFLLFQLFFTPTAVRFDAVVGAPTKGFFGPVDPAASERAAARKADELPPFRAAETKQPFSIMPRSTIAERVQVESPGSHMIIEWRQVAGANKYDAYVALFADCPLRADLTKMPRASWMRFSDVSELAADFSAGQSYLTLTGGPSTKLSFTSDAGTMYWLEAEPTKTISTVRAFVDGASRIRAEASSGSEFYLNAPLAIVRDQIAVSAERVLTLKINGETRQLRLGGDKLIKSERMQCRAVAASATGSGQLQLANSSESPYFIGALVQLRPQPGGAKEVSAIDGIFNVADANGWVDFTNIDFERTTDRSLGRASAFAAYRNVKRLLIDGEPVPTDEETSLAAFGDFTGALREAGLRIEGEADKLWVNETRRNPTRWERLSLPWQLPIAGFLFGLMGLSAKWLRPRLIRLFSEDRAFRLEA